VEDLDALAGAVDEDGPADDAVAVAVLLGGEGAGDRVVGGERVGEGGAEVVDKVGGGEVRRGVVEAPLLVVAVENADIPGA